MTSLAARSPKSSDTIVAMADVRFAWPGGPTVVDIGQFDLSPGESVFLHGPSGSGKTTLLNLIAGMASPGTGRIDVMGASLGSMSGAARDRHRADHIGFIFQMFNLIPYLSVLENVTLACEFSVARRKRAVEEHGSVREDALRLLAHLGMADRSVLHRPATGLSVGQQQRVAAARALIGSPALVIADEPTSALDTERRDAFIDLIFDECKRAGTALLFVSHDRSLAARFHRSVALADINKAAA